MPRDLFTSPSGRPETRRSTRLLPLSIVLHALILAAIVIAPLLAVGELPRIAGWRTVAILATAPPPLPPPLPVEVRAAPGRAAAPSSSPDLAVDSPASDPGPPAEIGLRVGSGSLEALSRGLPSTGVGDFTFSQGTGGSARPAGAPGGPLPVGGDIQRPRRIRHVTPEYPLIARQAGIQGTVVIDAIIGEDGRVRQATVRESKPLLDEAALRAVRQWVYTPTRLNGVPVAVIMTVEVHFTLGR